MWRVGRSERKVGYDIVTFTRTFVVAVDCGIETANG